MKIRAVILAALLVGSAWPAAAHNGAIDLCADQWCPYNCAPGDAMPGYVVEIAVAAFAPRTVDYHVVSWSRCLKMVEEGAMDGAIGMARDEGPAMRVSRQTIAHTSDVFVTRADSTWTYDGPASLDKVSLGVVAGYDYGDVIARYLKRHARSTERVQVAHGDDATLTNVAKLRAGRLDTIIIDENVARYEYAKGGSLDQLRVAGRLAPLDLYIGFSPVSPRARDLPDLLDAGLERLRASGELTRILARYGLKDWARPGLP
jgi:polar amino acid transport system substrate-binding protein